MRKVCRISGILSMIALAASLCASVCHAEEVKTEYSCKTLDEEAFDGQLVQIGDRFGTIFLAYIPAEFVQDTSSRRLGYWELEDQGDGKRGEFSVQSCYAIVQDGLFPMADMVIAGGIEQGDEPWYSLANLAMLDGQAESVSKDDFVTVNGCPALVYPFQSYTQSGVSIYLYTGEDYLDIYLFLKNYENPEVIIDNVISSFAKPDTYAEEADTADNTGGDAADPDADSVSDSSSQAQKVYTDAGTIQKVQEALNNAGFDCGTPDGIAGDNTNRAITDFKAAKGISGGAEITGELLTALGIQAEENVPAADMTQISLPTYLPVDEGTDLGKLSYPILDYVNADATGADGIDGDVCISMYYGTKIMNFYQRYVDAGNSSQSVLGELAMEIIVGSMDHDLKAQYPQLKEQYNTALDAAKLALTEPGNSYMVQMEATPGGWTGEDVDSVNEAVAGAFDRIISGN